MIITLNNKSRLMEQLATRTFYNRQNLLQSSDDVRTFAIRENKW